MTSKELFKAIEPNRTEKTEARLRPEKRGLDANLSDIFSQLIKDAARTNRFQSDVYYDLKIIENRLMRDFDPEEEFEPIWVGFRRDGVDGTNFVLVKAGYENSVFMSLYHNYFALYSVTVEPDEEYNNYFKICFNEYYM